MTVLGVQEVKAGRSLSVGEEGEVLVPREVLGTGRAEVLRYAGKTAVALVPEGARVRVDGCERTGETEIEIVRGHTVEVLVGAFVLRMARVRPARRPAAAPLQSLRDSGLGAFAGSALFHAAAFAFVSFLAPSLGAAEEDSFDGDRIALMQHLLDASAQRENERIQEQDPGRTTNQAREAGKPPPPTAPQGRRPPRTAPGAPPLPEARAPRRGRSRASASSPMPGGLARLASSRRCRKGSRD